MTETSAPRRDGPRDLAQTQDDVTRPVPAPAALEPEYRDGSPADEVGEMRTLSSEPRRATPQDTALQRGQQVGRYVIVDKLGAGGMGVVYRAFDPDLDRSVALKLVALDGYDTREERSRLLREAQAMARLSHPNVIPVFDVGAQAQTIFVAMELVDGTTLHAWMQATKRSWSEVLAHFIPAGRGLAAAHAAGLIHRDFKPDNVMVGHDGRVRVLDFGLARTAACGPADDERTAEFRAVSGPAVTGGRSLDLSMTAAGVVMGTPAYMSPEQHLGVRVTAASDQFSYCVALWEALYGERPFAGGSLSVLAANVMQGKLRPIPAASAVPGWVHAALRRGLAIDDALRYPSMDALLRALDHDPRARRRTRVALVGSGVGILALGGVLGARWGSEPLAHDDGAGLCTGSEAAMAEHWNDARRDALRDAFAATNLAYAPAVWRHAAAQLDAYAAEWVDARTDACRATRVSGEQSEAALDRRMLCLARSRTALTGMLDALADPDDTVVERTIDAVRGLPDIAACADPEAQHETWPMPEDPQTQRAIADAQAALDRVRAQVAVGHYAWAAVLLAPVLVTQGALDYPPLSADARAWEGDILAQAGTPERAREAYLDAYAAATAADDVATQARVAGELAFEFGYRAADQKRGTQWLSIGRALVRRGGARPEQAAQLDSAHGAILVAAGDYPAAIAAHERARAYWTANAPDSTAEARVLDDIGAAEIPLGKINEAIAHHRTALAIRQRIYGNEHPVVAASERELGMSLSKAGRDDEAVEPLLRALAIDRQTRGERSTAVATVLDDLGRIERRRGNLPAALAYHQQALPLWEALLGESHPDVAVSLLGIGYTLVAADRPADAVPIQRRALTMFEATVGQTHPYVIYAANALGMAQLSAGDPAGAIAPLEQALALRGVVEVDPTLFADTLLTLGKARFRTAGNAAQRGQGRALVVEARDLFATQGARWTKELAELDAWLAAPT